MTIFVIILIFAFLALLIILLLSLFVKWTIAVHFERFGLPEDQNFKRIFNIFKTGSIVIISFALLFLILYLI